MRGSVGDIADLAGKQHVQLVPGDALHIGVRADVVELRVERADPIRELELLLVERVEMLGHLGVAILGHGAARAEAQEHGCDDEQPKARLDADSAMHADAPSENC